jgi:hypothetical protein
MLTYQLITFDQQQRLDRWNRRITEALNRRDKAALRALAKTIAVTAETLTGSEKARANALTARAEAGVRYLRGWRGWRRLTPRATWRAYPE